MHRATRRTRVTWTGGLAWGVALALVTLAGSPAGAVTSAQKAQARKALLTLHDMPAGWTSQKASNSNSSLPGAATLATCLGVPKAIVDNNWPTVNSAQFSSQNHLTTVGDTVSLDPSAKDANEDFHSLDSPKAASCLTTLFNGVGKRSFSKSFGTGAVVGTVQATRLPASDVGPGAANFALFFPVTMQGQTLNVEVVETDFAKGSEEQNVTFFSVGGALPASTLVHLTTLADSRL
jgi:hypothetical protein